MNNSSPCHACRRDIENTVVSPFWSRSAGPEFFADADRHLYNCLKSSLQRSREKGSREGNRRIYRYCLSFKIRQNVSLSKRQATTCYTRRKLAYMSSPKNSLQTEHF